MRNLANTCVFQVSLLHACVNYSVLFGDYSFPWFSVSPMHAAGVKFSSILNERKIVSICTNLFHNCITTITVTLKNFYMVKLVRENFAIRAHYR